MHAAAVVCRCRRKEGCEETARSFMAEMTFELGREEKDAHGCHIYKTSSTYFTIYTLLYTLL